MPLDPKSVEGGSELTSGALLEKSPPPATPAAGLTTAFGSSLNPPKQRVVRMLRHFAKKCTFSNDYDLYVAVQMC